MENLLQNLKEYQEICTVPFNTSGVRMFLRDKIINKQNITENAYCLYYNNGKNIGKRKLIIMCHTDHPGITLKSNKTGIFWGTPGYTRLQKMLQKMPISLAIFDSEGNRVGKGALLEINDPIKQMVTIQTDVEIKDNFSAQYDIAGFTLINDSVHLYNADDGVNVSIMLELVNQNIETALDIYYVFNLHEEVYQITSWRNAKSNYFDVNKSDIIINLECLKIDNVNPAKYPMANYDNGVVLQLSNVGCLFGYKNPGDNLSEKIVLESAKRAEISIQTGVIKDSCDSRPFTEFGLTPNICSLTIPNKYKHNERGEKVAQEEIKLQDINNSLKILQKIGSYNENDLNAANNVQPSLAGKIKSKDDVTDHSLMRAKNRLNNRIDVAYRNIVKRGYYYPITLRDKTMDTVYKLLSYIDYLIQKLTKQ